VKFTTEISFLVVHTFLVGFVQNESTHSVVSEYINYAKPACKNTSCPNCQKDIVYPFVVKMLLFVEYGTICRKCICIGYTFVGLICFSGKRMIHLFFCVSYRHKHMLFNSFWEEMKENNFFCGTFNLLLWFRIILEKQRRAIYVMCTVSLVWATLGKNVVNSRFDASIDVL